MDNLELALKGLNCPHCAEKIENKIKDLNIVDDASLNFINKSIRISVNEKSSKKAVLKEVKRIVSNIEPDVKVLQKEENGEAEENEDGNFIIKSIVRIILGSAFFAAAIVVKSNMTINIILFVLSYIIFGYDVIIRAVKNLIKGDLFDENFLMSIATIGAFIIGEYPEGAAVMLFYQIGEFFQDLAVERSRKSIKSLMNIKPEFANVIRDNDIIKTSPEDVSINDIIIIKPGEKIPLDGEIIDGNSLIDMSALIGESVPRDFSIGDKVLSGAINQNSVIKVKVEKEYSDSTVSKILDLVENASNKKSKTESFITKFAKIYTPVVVVSAVFLTVIPWLVTGNFYMWLSRSLVFLVSSCPCALVVSIPLGFFSGIGAASKRGILIKGSNYLQLLNEIDTVVFDKTGTLTKGIFEVSKIEVCDNLKQQYDEKDLLKLAYCLERFSNHPVAKCIVSKYLQNNENEQIEIEEFKEIYGYGLVGKLNDKKLIVGNDKLMNKENIKYIKTKDKSGTVVYVSFDSKFIGNIIVSDKIKDDSKIGINQLKLQGIKNTIMLTGDRKEIADEIAKELKIDNVYSELLPQEKVEKIEEIYNKSENAKIAFVGDGINDAPVLARADVGIAMGAMGSDAAIEAADVVIMNDQISKLSEAVSISKNTIKIVKQNVFFVLAVKFIVISLAAFGYANMWLAVFADVGVALLAILNSMKKK